MQRMEGRAQRPTWVPPGDKGPGLKECTSNRDTSRPWALYRQLRSLPRHPAGGTF